MLDFLSSVSILLALLNPFLVIVYLFDVVKTLDREKFYRVLLVAAAISAAVFSCFALIGDVIFSSLVQAEFASFQIFGGIVFLLIGIQFVFKGPSAVEILHGKSENLAGAIAMPVLIGPGTLSASVVVGKRLDPLVACGAIVLALGISVSLMLVLKEIHDYVRKKREYLVQRYIEVAGRVTALYVGTIAVEMIMRGLQSWVQKF